MVLVQQWMFVLEELAVVALVVVEVEQLHLAAVQVLPFQ